MKTLPFGARTLDEAVRASRAQVARAQAFLNRTYKRDKDGRFSSGGGGSWDTRADRQAAVAAAAATPVVDAVGQGGFMGGTSRETHSDGTTLIHKQPEDHPDGGSMTGVRQADAEELGSLVGSAVGLPAPAVHRAGPTDLQIELGSGTHIEHDSLAPWKDPPPSVIDSDHGRLMGVLDIVAGNPDRHAGNYLLREDGGITPVDNALSFGRHGSSALSSPFTQAFVNKAGNDWAEEIDISPRDIGVIRGRLESLRPEFDRLGRGDWHDTMMENLDILAPRATGTRDRVT